MVIGCHQEITLLKCTSTSPLLYLIVFCNNQKFSSENQPKPYLKYCSLKRLYCRQSTNFNASQSSWIMSCYPAGMSHEPSKRFTRSKPDRKVRRFEYVHFKQVDCMVGTVRPASATSTLRTQRTPHGSPHNVPFPDPTAGPTTLNASQLPRSAWRASRSVRLECYRALTDNLAAQRPRATGPPGHQAKAKLCSGRAGEQLRA